MALAVLLTLASGCAGSDLFRGTELAPEPGAEFRLRDQFGQLAGLSDMRGKVVVLSFLYTRCPDVCPLTAESLRQAYEALGNDAPKTAFLVVSVDPVGDTQQEVYRYSEEKSMLNRWLYLTGSQEELEPVWRAYYVGVEHEHATSASTATPSPPEGTIQGLVGHSAPVFLIDQQGRLRVMFTDSPLDYRALVHDIRMLLR